VRNIELNMESLRLRLCEYLKEKKCLTEIYAAFDDEKESTIRGRLNENVGICFERLGRGVYIATDGEVQAIIIHGDSWEALKDLSDESVDAIIMDSPYSALDLQMTWGTTRERNRRGGWDFTTKDPDEALYGELLRVLKKGGHMFSFMPACKADTHDFNEKQIRIAEEAGWTFNSQFIWDKKHMGMGYNGRARHELIHFFSKGKRRLHQAGHTMRRTPDVLVHGRIPARRRIHQTEKPIALIAELIEFSTLPGEVVLDPFAGSLSTASAALQTNRNAVCIEIDRSHMLRAFD